MASREFASGTLRDIIYNGSGTYSNNIGTELTLSEDGNRYKFLAITCFCESISSTKKLTILYIVDSGVSYYNVTYNGTVNWVRCQLSGNKFTLLSSSYSSLYVGNIKGIP